MKLKRVKAGSSHRWKKGQSCVSNPENNKFRSAAQGNFFQNINNESGLTVEALAKHTATLHVEPRLCADPEDDKSIGQSFNTFATNFTTCTIPAFQKFFKNFSVSSEMQTRMLAIHAAAQEYIQDAHLPETSTSYTCALMGSLEGVKDSEEDVCATLSLLAKVIRKVSKDVLRAKFAEYSKLLNDIFTLYSETSNLKLLINAIGCISILLRAQEEVQWNYPSTNYIFHKIVAYTTHENADVRRSAVYNVSAVLIASSFLLPEDLPKEEVDEEMAESPENAAISRKQNITTWRCHPSAPAVGQFILLNLKLSSQQLNGKATLYLLSFLQQVIASLPEKTVEQCCSRVLGVMHIGDSVINSRALKVFGALFSCHKDARPSPLSLSTHEALLNALTSSDEKVGGSSLKIVPGLNHEDVTPVWMDVVASGVISFVGLNNEAGVRWFCRWTEQLCHFWESSVTNIREKVWYTIDLIFDECIKPLEDKSKFMKDLLSAFNEVQKYLSLQHRQAWPFVFSSLGPFFTTLGSESSATDHIVACLKNLASLAVSSEVVGSKELRGAVGAAIRSIGPEQILKAVPFQITGDIEKDEIHFWILPLLKQHVRGFRLSFFVSHFVPLVNQCSKVVQAFDEKDQSNSLLARTYKQIEWQIWALLPSFSKEASDIDAAFTVEFAQLLCNHIRTREDTRLNVLAALRHMLSSPDITPTSKLIVYSKNFLRALVSVYLIKPRNKVPLWSEETTADPGQRIAAFTTIQYYVPKVTPAIRAEFFKHIVNCYEIEEGDTFRRKTFFSLCRPFLSFLDASQLDSIKDIAAKEILNSKSPVQKIAYRILEDMIESESESCRSFIRTNFNLLIDLFARSSDSLRAPSKAARLCCLRNLLAHVTDSDAEVNLTVDSASLLHEAVTHCSPSNSAPARKAAFALLLAIGNNVRRVNQFSDEETFRHCFALMPPLVASSPSTANTVLALMALVYNYKDIVPVDLLLKILDSTCCLLRQGDRPTIKGSLSLIRMSFVLFPVPVLSDSLDEVVKAIVNIPRAHRTKFRDKIRDILASLARKFGADRVRALIPDNDMLRKVLTNVLKRDNRRKRGGGKLSGRTDEEEDEYVDDQEEQAVTSLDQILGEIEQEIETDEKQPTASRNETKLRKKKEAWIREEEDEILDLLDFSSGQNVTSKKPKPKQLRFADEAPVPKTDEEKYGFKVDKKSKKFIITDTNNDNDDDDDASDDLDILPFKTNKGLSEGDSKGDNKATQLRKRKRTTSENSFDSVQQPTKVIAASTSTKISRKKSFDYGSEFRSRKAAGGDVKKKGGLNPFAYVPLSKEKLNKRKKAKYAGQFKSIVRGARKGAAKGARLKTRKR